MTPDPLTAAEAASADALIRLDLSASN